MDRTVREKLIAFFSQYKQLQYKKGEILIRADDDPPGIFYLREGIVRQYYIAKNGEEITLNMFKPYSFFPMSWTVSDIHNNYFFEAMTNAFVSKAPKHAVLEFVKNQPDVLLDLLRRMYIGIEGLWMHIEYLSAGNALSKLSAALLILVRRFGKQEGGATVVKLKLSEKELGEYAGMYRETVSREFAILRENGLIQYEKGVMIIPNIKRLEDTLSL